ncbi:hypothetical protein ACLB2K_035755 [Fragaria x ananassa]
MADDQNCGTKTEDNNVNQSGQIVLEAVRSSWKYAANSYIVAPYYKPLPQSPWLVLGCCVGSSHGWLVIMNNDSIMNLLNPVSGESIQVSDIRAARDRSWWIFQLIKYSCIERCPFLGSISSS